MAYARQPSVPAVYGRYQTLFRIAAGGMAEVYAARVRGEAGFQKLVALKRMLPHLTDDERFVTMFMDEGKLAANIDSPNVVSTMDLGRADDGSLFLVMELVVGTTLSTLLRNAAKAGDEIPTDVACEILAQAGLGLHDAHEAKTAYGAPLQLVHRDISPQNILVGIDGRVRITDFGVARAVLRRTKTSTGEFKGKLSYFSPEQCAELDLDRRSDLFSLGVVAWETLTTRRLFHAENPLAVLERVTRMPIPSAHAVRPDVPTSVAAVVGMALERNRDQRQPSAAEFARNLRSAAREVFGAPDTRKITELVQRYGGEQLERMQRQLKESLANPTAFVDTPALLDDPTEISSGIVVRPGEYGGGVPPPSRARFALAGDDAPAAASKSSRAPLVVAVLIALLGVAGGVTIALMARTEPSDEGSISVLPSETDPIGAAPASAPAAGPNPAEADPAETTPPGDATEPQPAHASESATPPDQGPNTARPVASARRGRSRTGRRRTPHRRGVNNPTPVPQPLGETHPRRSSRGPSTSQAGTSPSPRPSHGMTFEF